MVTGDLLNDYLYILRIESIMDKCNVNINFLEYHSLCINIYDLMELLEKPLNNDILPRNKSSL